MSDTDTPAAAVRHDRSARVPRRRDRRPARAPPLPAAAGDVVRPGPDRLDRRPTAHQPLVERLPRADPPPADARSGASGRSREFGAGSGAVRTIAGTMAMHEALEAELAAFKARPAVLTFQSGFTANTGVIPTITGETDLIVSDALNHASIIDGMRLSKAPRKVYPHADVDALRDDPRARPRERGRDDGRRAVPADPGRDRRRVLDGRRHRAAPRDRRGGRGVRGGRDGRRRPRVGRPRARTAAARRPLRARTAASRSRSARCPRPSASLGGYVAGSQALRDILDPARRGRSCSRRRIRRPSSSRLPRGDPDHAGRARAAWSGSGRTRAASRPSSTRLGLRHRASRRRRSRRS